jgi:RecA-family ATPase
LADQSTYFTEQLDDSDGPGLWFNNEEQHKKVMLRCIQAALGVSMQDIAKDIRGYEEQYKAITKDKLKLPNFDTTHKREMEAICKEYKPSFIIIDQVSKVRGFNDDREDLRLGAAFGWSRDLAKEYNCPVIGVNQADGSGEGKKYLDMSNVANSKTAVQAEADFILGIGKSNDPGFELIRHFNISKNKLMGDEDSNPAMRHGKFDCLIQPELARYRDL